MPIPMDLLVGVAATPIPIVPDRFTSLYNIGQTHIWVNFITSVTAVRGTGNIEIPPGGKLPNLEMAIGEFSAISVTVPGRLLVMQSFKPMEVAVLDYDNETVMGNFNYTAINDNANPFFLYATYTGIGGTRQRIVVVEAVVNDVLLSFDGVAPVRIGLVGHYLAAGDSATYTIDSFVNLQAMNVIAGQNVNIRGAVYGV